MEALTLNPAIPGFHGTMVMILVVFALILFASEKLPLASASLVVLVVLCLVFETVPFHAESGRLRASDLLLGFGHQALIAVCALMVAGQGLVTIEMLQCTLAVTAGQVVQHSQVAMGLGVRFPDL